jgi:CTP synthase (UTP-ammonia lyase)
MNTPVRIAIVGDFNPEFHSHPATNASIDHAAARLKMSVRHDWVATQDVGEKPEQVLSSYHGIWASPGSPYRSFEGMLRAIEFARTRQWPFVGT